MKRESPAPWEWSQIRRAWARLCRDFSLSDLRLVTGLPETTLHRHLAGTVTEPDHARLHRYAITGRHRRGGPVQPSRVPDFAAAVRTAARADLE